MDPLIVLFMCFEPAHTL